MIKPKYYVECEECGGSGDWMDSRGYLMGNGDDCPVCDGTGFAPISEEMQTALDEQRAEIEKLQAALDEARSLLKSIADNMHHADITRDSSMNLIRANAFSAYAAWRVISNYFSRIENQPAESGES